MNPSEIPWLLFAVGLPLFGALFVTPFRNAARIQAFTAVFSGASLCCSTLAMLFCLPSGAFPEGRGGIVCVCPMTEGMLGIDLFSAPMLPAFGILHLLTVVTTARTQERRFPFRLSLVSLSLMLALFASLDPWLIIGLLLAQAVPPVLEMRLRKTTPRVFLLHQGLAAAMLVAGQWLIAGDATSGGDVLPGVTLILAGLLVRSGIFPLHCWLPDLFARSSFGFALLFAAPLPALYGVVRLVLPTAPESLLEAMEIASLVTATYAAGMATIQTQPRRLFAYLFLSQSSLVFVGMELETTISLTGALCLWYSVCLALGGLGLTLRAIEARFGKLDLRTFQGLYEQAPALAVACLMTGLGSVGFPGTIGFISADLLVDGAVKENLWLGLIVVSAVALTGIAVIRMYFLIFTGRRHASAIPLGIRPRERWAVLTLTVLIVGIGLFPQYGVRSRHEAAEQIHRTSAATATQKPPEPIAEPEGEE